MSACVGTPHSNLPGELSHHRTSRSGGCAGYLPRDDPTSCQVARWETNEIHRKPVMRSECVLDSRPTRDSGHSAGALWREQASRLPVLTDELTVELVEASISRLPARLGHGPISVPLVMTGFTLWHAIEAYLVLGGVEAGGLSGIDDGRFSDLRESANSLTLQGTEVE
jgi:hypothetical protein